MPLDSPWPTHQVLQPFHSYHSPQPSTLHSYEPSLLPDSSGPAKEYGPDPLPPMPWFGMDIGGTLSKVGYSPPPQPLP